MTNTLKTIAESQGVSKRTAQRWYEKAKEQLGDFGALVGQTLTFTDTEANNIVTYGASTTVAAKPMTTIVDKPTTSPMTSLVTTDDKPTTPTDDTDDMTIADVAVLVPTSFDLSAITGEFAPIDGDPLAHASQALSVMDDLMAAIEAKEQRLQQEREVTRQKRKALEAKAQQLQMTVNNHRMRAEFNAALQQQDLEAAGEALKKLQDLAGSG